MIDNNIVQALGAGSGIDTNNLVKQLTAVERAAPQLRIDSKRELAESQISDFGLLKSALSTLRDAASVLTDPEGLFSKTASFTESDALVPTTLNTDVAAGSYAFTVGQVAQAQSLVFEGFSSPDDTVGEGTLTFNFGSWSRDGSGVINGAFTQDTDVDSTTITIDSTNNSLEGLRDAINAADIGISASVVFDGSDYHLTLLAESGENNQLDITVSEAGSAPTNTDGSDLSRFTFNDQVAGFESRESQRGQDAQLTLNGLSVTRESNTVDDLVEGLTLDILQATGLGETVTVTVSEDKAFAEQNIRAFVEAFNTFLDVVDPIFGFSEVEDENGELQTVRGSLANDGLAKSALTQIRSVIASAIPGLANSDLTSLTNIGIRTELDGTLSIDEEDFQRAFDDNFDDLQKLFAPVKFSESSDITFNSFGDNTQAGTYEVVVTQAPSKGFYAGAAFDVGVTFPFDTTGGDYSLELSVSGTSSGTIAIPDGVYADGSALAGALQSAINNDENLSTAGRNVSISFDGSALTLTADQYGANSVVNITSAGTDIANNFGLIVQSGTTGDTVAGTINGVAAFGSANVLLPALGQPGEGLGLIIGENATSGTVNFSRGFAGELEELIDNFLGSSGLIESRDASLQDELEDLDEDEERLDRRIEAFEQRLIQQYIAMERILNSLNSSGSFLDNLIDTLPFTARNE